MQPEDLANWELCTSRLADQVPWWEPGTASGYHAVTQGYLIGEIVRRITGESIGTWFAREVAKPLEADFFIGLPASEDHRVSNVIPPPPIDIAAFEGEVCDILIQHVHSTRRSTPPWRTRSGGAGPRSPPPTARAMPARWPPSSRSSPDAGEARGVRLLSAEGTDPIFEVQADGVDKVLGVPQRIGMGYGLSNPPDMPLGPHACYWGGYGGSVIIMDQDDELTICYVMNRMESGLVGDSRGADIAAAAVLGLAS